MRIALDYDDTYSLDPPFWNSMIDLAISCNHSVVVITKRGPDNQGPCPITPPVPVIYTNRAAKKQFADQAGEHIDVWIDDNPMNLYREG